MEKQHLNSSIMSSASAISAIGLESTMTEEFQELKALQVEVANQVDKVVDYYERVKGIIDKSQNRSGQRLVELETFDEEQHAAVEMLSDYYSKTALAVRLNVDAKSRRRVKKIHRFVNMMVKLPATKEMADDGEPDEMDEQFLAERDASFPIGMIPAGALEFPITETPIKGVTQERKISAKGFSEITSTYGLRRGRDFLEKFTTPAKKALADLSLTPKTNAASKEFDPIATATATAVRLIAAQTAAARASVLDKTTNSRLPRASSPKDPKEPAVKRKQKKTLAPQQAGYAQTSS